MNLSLFLAARRIAVSPGYVRDHVGRVAARIVGIMALKTLILTLCMTMTMHAHATDRPEVDENFMLVLREVEGANKKEFGLVPTGPSTAMLEGGEKVTFNLAWFNLIGDMHVRFVMDGEHTMQNLTMEELSKMGVSPEQAVELAVANIKNRYGSPRATEWDDGIMLVSGESSDLDSSYFLDRAFWDDLLGAHPEGVVVGVPKRGGLIFAPVADRSAVTALEASIGALYETSENLRVSSALYLYKGGRWSVYRNPASSAAK